MPELEQVSTTNAGITVTFDWNTDRYEKTIQSDAGTLKAALSDNVETPVFNDLLPQDGLVFLSGMSDDRHWSMSVEPTDGGFAFDIACRAKSEVNRIGSVLAGDTAAFEIQGEVVKDAVAPTINQAENTEIIAEANNSEPPLTVHYRFQVLNKV